MGFEINTIDLSGIEGIANIGQNKTAMLQVQNALAKRMMPYVPMDTGTLSQATIITPEYVEYVMQYAHYMYTGVVYGPNFPIYENGVIVGYWSPPIKKPTGAEINYSKDKHSRATHHWDKAMMSEQGDRFINDVANIIKYTIDKGKS